MKKATRIKYTRHPCFNKHITYENYNEFSSCEPYILIPSPAELKKIINSLDSVGINYQFNLLNFVHGFYTMIVLIPTEEMIILKLANINIANIDMEQ